MIGNPYKFSVVFGKINDWNIDETFCNGFFLICVDGIIYPKEIINTSLQREILIFKKKLQNLFIDDKLFNLPKENAFIEIYNLSFPKDQDIDNDYRFDITPESFSDHDCFVFAVRSHNQVRIMASKLNYLTEDSRHDLECINVSETMIEFDELNKIITEIHM